MQLPSPVQLSRDKWTSSSSVHFKKWHKSEKLPTQSFQNNKDIKLALI